MRLWATLGDAQPFQGFTYALKCRRLGNRGQPLPIRNHTPPPSQRTTRTKTPCPALSGTRTKTLSVSQAQVSSPTSFGVLTFAVNTNGGYTSFSLGINPNCFRLIPTNQDLYCVYFFQPDYIQSEILKLKRDGGWLRAYGFADGHSELHKAANGDFGPWEAQRLLVPSNP